MSTQNDFLDNAVNDELAIDRTEDLNAEMCSSLRSDTEKMCSSLRSDTCGERNSDALLWFRGQIEDIWNKKVRL